MTHPHEETNCVASKDPYKNIGSGDPCDAGTHCVHWWDGEACCWCGDDHCAAARDVAGNPYSPQAVVFLTSIIDVIVGY